MSRALYISKAFIDEVIIKDATVNNIINLVGSTRTVANIVAKVDTITDLLQIDTSKLETGEQFYVLGYHTRNDDGGGIFYWDANEDKSNHNGGTIIDPTQTFPSDWSDTTQQETWFTASGTGNGCWKRVISNYVSSEMFGAKGDGVTDDTKAIQRAGMSFNVIEFGNKEYKFAESIFYDRFDRYVIITNETIFSVSDSGSFSTTEWGRKVGFFVGRLTDSDLFPNHTTLSQEAEFGDNTIVVSDVGIFSIGDYICLWDDTTGSYSQYRDYYYNGEFAKVVDIDTANSRLYLDKTLESLQSYPTTTKVYKVNFATFLHKGKVTFKTPRSSNLDIFDTFVVNGVVDSSIDSISVDNCNYIGFGIRKSYKVSVNSVFVYSDYKNSTENAYPFTIINSSNIAIKSLKGSAWWHVFSTGGGDNVCSIVNRNITIDSINVSKLKTQEVDTSVQVCDLHGNIDGFFINSGKIVGGFISAGNNVRICCDVFYTGDSGAIYHGEVVGYNFDYSRCRIYHKGNSDSTYRGVFDFGGNNDADTYVKFPGVIRLPKFIKSDQSETLVCIVKRTDSDVDMKVVLTDAMLITENGSKVVINIKSNTSSNIREVVLSNLQSNKRLYISLANVGNKSGIIQQKYGTFTLSSGSSYATHDVTFDISGSVAPVGSVFCESLYEGSTALLSRILGFHNNSPEQCQTTIRLAAATADSTVNASSDRAVRYLIGLVPR